MKDFCCTDDYETYATYASRCHKRIAECIYKTELHCQKGICAQPEPEPEPKPEPEPEPEPVAKGPCVPDSAWYQWNVMCDCNGYFKPIQCDNNICWCVDKTGGPKSATVHFEGSDKL